ncbi:hypothetical protein [Paraburkholderia sp. GAS32]|uniref:hypothetical protein n=1 Tax=Paraburkholderia sp. GAS32 TaxID=3035129 RepID=UPI003D1F9706
MSIGNLVKFLFFGTLFLILLPFQLFGAGDSAGSASARRREAEDFQRRLLWRNQNR